MDRVIVAESTEMAMCGGAVSAHGSMGAATATTRPRGDNSDAFVRDVWHEVLKAVADEGGPSRREIGMDLNVSASAVQKWALHGETLRMGALHLVDLLCGDAGLPKTAWRLLADRLGERGGFVIVERAMPGSMTAEPLGTQVMDVMEQLGGLAAAAREAFAEGGDGGKSLTPAERGRMLELVGRLEREAAEVRVMLEVSR